ncbi:hypothetical protein SBOR_6832 [Sclerotinia borealis F-4128]|uniref:SnoaL-like domain-containing protein n=1 Tax=Sclerotinia borealis (strain F-4128) TaxID=1432307 RepID=W9CDZ9_SCLBF|nr:hypothetical protein SBOR_6832 [Sclerotinia borealis F-4128]
MQLSKLLIIITGLIHSTVSASEYSGCPNISPGPATVSQLADILPISPFTDPIATESIRNTLTLYAFAVDGRNWPAFSRIFAPNVRANYSEPLGITYGLANITNSISAAVAIFAGTHHRYGTQYIAICSPTSAISVTYLMASHFFLLDIAPVVEDDTHTLFATSRYEDT